MSEMTLAYGTLIDVNRHPHPPRETLMLTTEEDRGPNDREGYAVAYLTPTEARQLAAELVRLADEIESEGAA